MKNTNVNVLTIDLEEWFHIFDESAVSEWGSKDVRIFKNTERILHHLRIKNIRATFLVLGWIARKYPQLVNEISSQGHEIGTHSDHHIPVYIQNRDQFRNDLVSSINALEDVIQKKIEIYRAPGFSIRKENAWAFEELAKQGIIVDLSVFPGALGCGGMAFDDCVHPYVINTQYGPLKELPISVINLFGIRMALYGGGYFRLLPYPFMKMMGRHRSYKMAYFHPRDFDYEQPRIKLKLKKYFKAYVGLKTAFRKFEKLLNEESFTSVTDAVNKIQWSNMKSISSV